MTVNRVAKIISQGTQDLFSVKLNSGHTGYEANGVAWTGEIAVNFTPKRERTVLAAGNDPAWGVAEGPVIGDVEVKLYGLPLDIMPELLGVTYNADEGVCVGDDDDVTPFVGMSFNSKVKAADGGSTSFNKLILHKVQFELPEVASKTVAENDPAVGDVTLKGKAYPVFFNKANGKQGSRTYCIVNSVTNATKYNANKDTIVFPTAPTTPAAQGTTQE